MGSKNFNKISIFISIKAAVLFSLLSILACKTPRQDASLHSGSRSLSTSGEFDDFFRRNSVRESNFENYLNQYKYFISAAATATFFSEDGGYGSSSAVFQDAATTFLSCAYWQESRFDPQAKSYVGASGIAQLMSRGAQAEIQNILSERKKPTKTWIQQLRRDLANNDWRYYWSTLRKPNRIKQNTVNPLLPEEAVIAGALYYRYLFVQLKSYLHERGFCSASLHDFFLLAAASYNGGLGLGSSLAGQYIQKHKRNSFREEAIGKIGMPDHPTCDNETALKRATNFKKIPTETLKYICNISRCMDAGYIRENLSCPVR